MDNPLLLKNFSLPPFSKIKSEHIIPAITEALTDCRNTVENVLIGGPPYTWENLFQPLSETEDVLERIFSAISHLNSVKNSSELRKVYEKTLLLLSEYNNWVSQKKNLYKAYCNLRFTNNKKYNSLLNIEQKKSIDNILRNFKLSGINLAKKKKERYGEIIKRLSELGNQYNNNVLDATMGWTKTVLKKEHLLGIPENTLIAAKKRMESKGKKGWLLTLDTPNYLSVMTYCDNQALRKEMYQAYNTRASDQGPNAGKWDNSQIMNEILLLRHESAQLLGFKSYAHKSFITKMAKNPQQVFDFLNNLLKHAYSQGKREFAQLCTFAKENYGIEQVEPWDILWCSEKQKQHLYNINDEQLRSYFPEDKVLNGLFEIVRRIYNIFVKERYDVEVWHPDVRFFELYDENNELRGSFYLDLYVRNNKRDGAWMDVCVNQMRKSDGFLQKPVAYLTCNFDHANQDCETLLAHNEVITLFHEFGHGLHHMLTRIEITNISGINGIPWDAVELPSQFMENWCWEPNALSFISSHYKTGLPLPEVVLNKIVLSKNYQSAMFILRQIELGLFDLSLHTSFNPDNETYILETFTKIKNQVSVTPWPTWGRFPHTFSHIFSGEYASGYYSYLWSNVLASDAFSLFKERGIFDKTIGRSFHDNILSRGGCEDPMKLFKRFRGRKPQIFSMLKHYGIKNSS